MKLRQNLFVLLISLCFAAASCGSDTGSTPTVTLSRTRVPSQEHVDVQGIGFTPSRNVTSHLRTPDGTEFPVLPILTDGQGEFTHDIDTLLLTVGTHELWVVDDMTNVSSNVARFEVTPDQPPIE
jgi:hypothetical protein